MLNLVLCDTIHISLLFSCFSTNSPLYSPWLESQIPFDHETFGGCVESSRDPWVVQGKNAIYLPTKHHKGSAVHK